MSYILCIYCFWIFEIGFMFYWFILYYGLGVKNWWGLFFFFDVCGIIVNGLFNYFLGMLKKKIIMWFFEFVYIYCFFFIDLIFLIDIEI